MTPWSWRVPAAPWFSAIEPSLAEWQPHPALQLDERIVGRLVYAAQQEREWLYHPLLCAVTLGEQRLERDLRLALWIAVHEPEGTPLGEVSVPRETWAWAPDGGSQVSPGRYDLVELANTCRLQAQPPVPIALDVWIDAVGLPLPAEIVDYELWSWAHQPPLSDDDQVRLQRNIMGYLRAVAALGSLLPECAAWVAGVARIVVPLCGTPETRFRSGTSAALPGLIFSDVDGPITQVLESLVHESAHLWFCLAEAEGPLVDPAHDGRYTSPLRSDPRPLRGIFLAFHALAFMSAFYHDWAEVAPGAEQALQELDVARRLCDDAAQTLRANRSSLTERGAQLLDLTENLVVAHAK